MPDTQSVITALLLTLGAGMATGIGALITMFARRDNTRLLAFSMGLSAGVMVFVSLTELLPQASTVFARYTSEHMAHTYALLWFFGGIALIALIDKLVPEDENPHEQHTLTELEQPNSHHLHRTGMMLAAAIGIHNFPEGMATFVSALDGIDVALPIFVAIALHNIPEGIAVFVPIYHSTGNRSKALRYTIISGLAEPLGAVAGMLFLLPLWSPQVNAAALAAVAGIMIYISFDELLPGAEQHGHHHAALAGVLIGMAVMGGTMIFV